MPAVIETHLISVTDVDYDFEYLPRRLHSRTVNEYVERLVSDPSFEFPPIHVVWGVPGKKAHMCLDGIHRLRAYVLAERKKILAIVETLPRSKWLARATELNLAHGLPLKDDEKERVVQKLEGQGWTIKKIAALFQVRVETIERLRIKEIEPLTPRTATIEPIQRPSRERLSSPHSPASNASGQSTQASQSASNGGMSTKRPDGLNDTLLKQTIRAVKKGLFSADNPTDRADMKELKQLLERALTGY